MTASISSIDLFNLLRVKIGDQEANALTTYVADEVERKIEEQKNFFATKEDINQLRLEMAKLREDLQVEMKEQKSEMIKWMFIFWIGQIGATLAIVFLFLKK